MKFQMAENSLFAILLRSPWWASFAIAAALAAVAAALLPAEYKVVGAMSSLPFVVIGTIAARRQWSQPSAARVAKTREALAAMAWAQFSSALDAAFRREGFSVRAGAGAPVDFELERAGRRTLVCARKWKSARTGLEALRALQAARDASDATDAIYVCVGEISETALPYAKQQRIEIWGAEELARRLGR